MHSEEEEVVLELISIDSVVVPSTTSKLLKSFNDEWKHAPSSQSWKSYVYSITLASNGLGLFLELENES